MLSLIPSLTCPQHLPSSPSYPSAAHQYASTTHAKDYSMSPGLIVQPESLADIRSTILFARENNLAIALRSGGHAFGGFSSTTPAGIQLDLSRTFRGPADQSVFEGADGQSYMRTSISYSLGEFNAALAGQGCFVPHGNCNMVFLGGHVQTGGFGQLARSFGLLGDQVASIKMVDADGEVKTVTQASDPEMFFAVLGGSPGNLGVVTHVTLRVQRDAQFKGARGLKIVYPYAPETLKALLDEVVRTGEMGRGYDLSVQVASGGYPIVDLCRGMEEDVEKKFPEWMDETKKAEWPATIAVFAQCVPFEGEELDLQWLEQLETIAEPLLSSGVQEVEMSRLTGWWLSPDREFDLPYQKRLYTSNSTDLIEKNWSQWAVGRVDEIMADKNNGLHVYGRFQNIGGEASQFQANANNGTAYSWRDTNMLAMLECFHGESSEKKQAAIDWQRVNDRQAIGPHGVFSEHDRRLLWNSNGNPNLDSTWSSYYEDREKYERLQKVRSAADPYGTFTANKFSVKRADAAKKMVAPASMNTGASDLRLKDEMRVVKKTLESN